MLWLFFHSQQPTTVTSSTELEGEAMRHHSYAAATGLLLTGVLASPTESLAQSASAQAMLEEVVVTARRREETLQDLPLSVAAITADAMQAQGVYAIEDITDVIPNLTLTSTDRRGIQALFIRGIGNDSTNNLTPVGAGLYIDGHYMPNTLGQMMSLLDVERIEVLRGPQGTLFGMNTTGGAVNIITTKPHDEFEGSVLLRAAEHGQQDFRGMLNIPLSDTVFSRISVSKEQMDGYYYNRTLNRDVGAIDVSAFAGALRFQPNDNWTIDLHYRQNQQRDDNAPGQCGARPTQEQVDNLYHDGLPVTIESDDGFGNDFIYEHPGFQWDGPVFADEGVGANDGVGQWGGSWGGNATLGGVLVDEDEDGDRRVDVGGHVERLYPGAVIDYWSDCLTDAQMGDYVTSYEKDTFVNLDNTTYGASFDWDSGGAVGALDNLNVRVNLSRHEVDYDYLQDRDFSSVKVDAIGTPPRGGFGQVQENSQLEVLFTGEISDRAEFVAGAIWFEDEWKVGAGDCLAKANANIAELSIPDEIPDPNDLDETIPNPAFTDFQLPCTPDGGTQFDRLADRMVGGGPGIAGMSGLVTRDSQAVFAHLTYDFSDAWSMDIGARWTEDTRLFNQAEVNVPGHLCTHTRFETDPPEDQQCLPGNYVLSYENLLVDGFYNNTERTWDEVTPMISFSRNFDNGSMMYFRIAEGFLSGSFNDELNVLLVPELTPLLSYDPEHITNYEVGYKGSFSDGMVNLAGAVFFMDYTDKQESIGIDNTDGRFGGDPNIGIVTNAATVDIYGVEVELRMIPWDNGFFSLDLGYLNNEYGEFSSFDPDAPGGSIDQSGLTIADYSPEWTLNATLEHAFELGNGATLRPQIGMYYQSEYDWIGGLTADQGDSFCLQDSYAKFRARLTYEPADANWEASIYGQNIGDERYLERCNDGRRSGAYDFRYGRPAWYGAEFVYRFGNN
jgi:outer membrane receptor protein involved in Fe transport